MTIFAHNDNSKWGQQFVLAAGRAGIQADLFENPQDVPAGACAFVRLDQQREQRDYSKWVVAELNRLGVKTIPTAAEGVWYDDKIAQVEPLSEYLPETLVINTADEAHEVLKNWVHSIGGYPFISKAKDGASSVAVRLIENEQQARQEIRGVFSREGIRSTYDRRQQGYLYWQRFIPDNDGDIRIIVMGKYLMGLWRKNRKDKPFASGSGNNGPIMDFSDHFNTLAAQICLEFAEKVKTQWMAFDVVFDETGKPHILELSSSWSPHAYKECPLFTHDRFYFKPSGRYGAEMFDVAVEIVAELEQ